MVLGMQPPLKKKQFYSVFFVEKRCQKTLYVLPLCPKKHFLGKMLNNKSEVTNWTKNTKQKDTNWHQNMSQKSSKKPYFCSAKMVPQEVVLFLTLEVVLLLTLERPKSGTKTNSPAHIYIYI